MKKALLFGLSVAATVQCGLTQAEVVRLEIKDQRNWARGQAFKAGPYEAISGTAWYEIDPQSTDAREITDIKLAPRNARGRVEYQGPFLIIRPKQASSVNGAALFEVANRGTDQSNRILFVADDFDLSDAQLTKDVAHAPLMDRGYTFAWAGWQSDLPAKSFGLTVPRAAANSTVRATAFLNVEESPADSGSAKMGGSCAADANDPTASLKIQRSYDDVGYVVPRSEWRFATRTKDGKVTADPCSFLLNKPVSGPALATLTYRGDQPLVTGLGLVAVRDFNAYLRTHEIAGRAPPKTIMAYGYSQSARFLRDFLYRGFNHSAAGRPVFDGVLDTGAGAGRGSFAHRYAQPGDAGNSVGSPLRAVDLYPFSDLPTRDITGRAREGLLDRARRDGVSPKIFHILSGTEFWARAGSLMQTTPDGNAALPEAPDTRTYVFAGTNHAPRPAMMFLKPEFKAGYPYNDNQDEFAAMPALTEAMRLWIEDGTQPVATQRPVLGKSLVAPAALAFPKLPGVAVPKEPPPVWQLDFGPRYRSEGITSEPPRIGARYRLLVPQVDEDGNEIGGWFGLRRSVPIGTYTAWNDTNKDAARFGIISGLSGALIPFSWDEDERAERKDPRKSLIARYGGRAGYMHAADAEIERQINAGFMLPDERAWNHEMMLLNWAHADALWYVWPVKPK
ncbi:Alpha/beta hydrolase domain-containing protein [Sphingomonas antarctica]|uniref:alpha/beta hydrolase domain-containing protein n=1 Tax=Sphingomonas antarctica TaxID=2040274 RepID=UPI0039EADBA6